MNAIATPPLSHPRVLQPGAGTRRWLTLLLSVEGIAALAGTITFAALAPDAAAVLPGLGASGAVAALLLAVASAALAIMAFSSVSAMVRRHDGAVVAATGVQLVLAAAALLAGWVNGFDQPVMAGLLLAVIGLLLAAVNRR